jgi:hypothetical protein
VLLPLLLLLLLRARLQMKETDDEIVCSEKKLHTAPGIKKDHCKQFLRKEHLRRKQIVFM